MRPLRARQGVGALVGLLLGSLSHQLLVSAPSPLAQFTSERTDTRPPEWREAVQCGPNALYILLRLRNWSGSLADVRSRVPVNDIRGCSLADLYEAAEEFGMRPELLKLRPGDLEELPTPALVHLEPPDREAHFSIFVGRVRGPTAERNQIKMYDPVALHSVIMPKGQFERHWSGYALIVRGTRGASFGWPETCTLAVSLSLASAMSIAAIRARHAASRE